MTMTRVYSLSRTNNRESTSTEQSCNGDALSALVTKAQMHHDPIGKSSAFANYISPPFKSLIACIQAAWHAPRSPIPAPLQQFVHFVSAQSAQLSSLLFPSL